MSKEKISIADLLEQLKETISRRGLKGTMELLRQGHDKDNDGHIQFVVAMVCTHFTITIDQLLQEKNDKTKYAKAFVVFYLRNDFDIEWSVIKIALNHKDQSWLWQLMKLVKELKPKLPAHTQWLAAKNNFDEQLKQYLKQQKK